MQTTWRFSIARLLVVTAAVGIAIAGWTKAELLRKERDHLAQLVQAQPRTPNDDYIRRQPLTVTMSDQGGRGVYGDWYAGTDLSGMGQIQAQNRPSTEQAEFVVSESQLAEFRESLIAERFFDLPNEVGDPVPDGGTESITVVVGMYSKTVRIYYLGNLANPPPQTSLRHAQDKAARLLRVWLLARDWFDHPSAFDGRPYSRRRLAQLDALLGNAAPKLATTDGSTDD